MDKKSFRYILFIITFSILIVFALWNIKGLLSIISNLLTILRPIIIGFIIAFVLNQPFNKLKVLFSKIFKKSKTGRAANSFAIISVYLLLLFILTAIIIIIIPEFSKSILLFSSNFDIYIENFKNLTNDIFENLNATLPSNIDLIEKLSTYIEEIPSIAGKIFIGAFGFTTSFIGTIVDIFLGLIISIYFLIGKNKLLLQSKKIIFAFFKEEKSKKLMALYSEISNTFTNFITGQIIEAFILGSLCFIGMSIFRFEYAFLISVLIGITNIIPIVGPFIGTIPSVLILLLVNPIQAFWFIIFIVILQQLESNLIYPRVVGTKVGLPALWVLVAIIIGGGLFGILGMLLAVPTMSIIYDLTRKNVQEKLKSNNLNID